MTIFAPENATRSAETQRVFAWYELLHTLIDFAAAACFFVGSIMFFSPAWQVPGTWLFVVGSALFAAKPTTRIVRELSLLAKGDVADVAAAEERRS